MHRSPVDASVDAIDAIDAGAAWHSLDDGGVGSIVARYRHAAYARFAEVVVAIGSASIPAGPLHLRLPSLPRMTVGEQLSLSNGWLAGECFRVEVGATVSSVPRPLDAAALREAAGRAALVTGGDDSALPGLVDLDVVIALIDADDLVRLARTIGGLGPGLTPSGDDVLAGVLLIDALAGRPSSRRCEAIAAARTTRVASSFLAWAARGQSIEPVHLLLAALAAGDDMQVAARQRTIRSYGSSSGADLLLGLRLGLDREGRG